MSTHSGGSAQAIFSRTSCRASASKIGGRSLMLARRNGSKLLSSSLASDEVCMRSTVQFGEFSCHALASSNNTEQVHHRTKPQASAHTQQNPMFKHEWPLNCAWITSLLASIPVQPAAGSCLGREERILHLELEICFWIILEIRHRR